MNTNNQLFTSIIAKFGWLGNSLFFFIAFIECIPLIGGFFPGGTLITIGGFLAAQGYFNVWNVLIFSILGAIIGDYIGFSLGRYGRSWLLKKKLLKTEFLTKGDSFFHNYGPMSIFWGRFIGAIRAIVPFIAGSSKMKAKSFLFWNISGAIGWAIYNVGVGYFAGNLLASIIEKASHELWLVLLIAVSLGIVYWIVKKHGQSLWEYFKFESAIFTKKLFAQSWYQSLSRRYPIISEFFENKVSQEKIYGGTMGIIILVTLYIIALISDWF